MLYDCMEPIKARKQLYNHLNGRDHRNVVDFRERTEEGYVPDRGRSPCGAALPSRRHGQETQTATEIFEPDEMRDADYTKVGLTNADFEMIMVGP